MAIKASASITLSAVVDVASVTRYYLLQASTLNKPSVPTTNPPGSSWDDTEPAYTDGSTNSLYFVDLTVFSDSSFSYSAVSLSSSYEAAKAAYNKAVAAQSSATQVASRVTAVEQKVTDSSIENVVKKSTTYKNLEGRVTSTESNISTVSQTADKINWIVSSDATSSSVKLTDAAYDVIADNIDLSANSTVKISSADQIDISAINALNLSSNGTITLMAGNITNAANAASKAQETADNITIGGKNLLRNSGEFLYAGSDASSDYTIGQWRPAGNNTTTRSHVDISDPPVNCKGVTGALQVVGTHPVSIGDAACVGIDGFPYFGAAGCEVVMSAWARVVGGGGNCYFGFNSYLINFSDGTILNGYHVQPLDSTGAWTRVVIHGTTYAASGNVYCGFLTGDNSVTLQACAMKFELGNKVTDWTPAPEDISDDVTVVSKVANNASFNANNATTLATNAQKAADTNADNLARVVRIVDGTEGAEEGYPYGYLEVGDNQTNASVRITSTSIDLCLEDQTTHKAKAVATYAQDYIRLKNMQIRVPDNPGGLVFSFYEG